LALLIKKHLKKYNHSGKKVQLLWLTYNLLHSNLHITMFRHKLLKHTMKILSNPVQHS